jgi:thiamine pyrophosphokinase
MNTNRLVIFANGVMADPEAVRNLLRESDFLVAVDGGTRHALVCGRAPDLVIGDMDSLSTADRKALATAGTRMIRFPPEKDETDLELAMQYAVREGYAEVLVIAALGGRIDQTLANLSLLRDPSLKGRDVRFDDGREEVMLVGREVILRGEAGDTVSLLPFGIEVGGITTLGLQYPLRGETLLPHRTRGVSNRLQGKEAKIVVEKGDMLCIHTRSKTGSQEQFGAG